MDIFDNGQSFVQRHLIPYVPSTGSGGGGTVTSPAPPTDITALWQETGGGLHFYDNTTNQWVEFLALKGEYNSDAEALVDHPNGGVYYAGLQHINATEGALIKF